MASTGTRMFERPVHAALFTFAAFVVAVAGLRAASSILVPILAAGFVALIISSVVAYLRKSPLPDWLAIPVTVLIVAVGFTAIGLIVTITANKFAENSGDLEAQLSQQVSALADTANGFLSKLGVDGDVQSLMSSFQLQDLSGQARSLASSFSGLLSGLFLFTIFVIFMLLESRTLPKKVKDLAGEESLKEGGRMHEIVKSVQTYLIVKTAVASMTGTSAGLACWAIGVPYPAFWGFLAFLFDFIPAFGAFFAAIPAAILALVVLGPLQMVLTLVAFFVVNAAVGNFIEPRLHGRNQSMSPLFILLSLIFWGWIFGPVGMLLGVPLSMILKISLEGSGEFKAFTVLVSSHAEVKD